MWFLLVGTTAALVHWGVVVALVERGSWSPLAANLLAWIVAFGVSFTGHHRFSFRGHGRQPIGSAGRFAVVSFTGLLVNETAYAMLLRWTGLPYPIALMVVLATVAVGTWLLSRHWVFRRTSAGR
ncbi:MAG: GtrA family protein [Burkholderiaceae bacterium]